MGLFHTPSPFAPPSFLAHDCCDCGSWISDWLAIRDSQSAIATPVFRSRSGMIPTRGPHMNRFHLATSALLAGALLAAGCAGPCGCGCERPSFFQRMSMFRARGCCPCECCGGYGGAPFGALAGGGCASCGGGAPLVGGPGFSDGPILGPGGPPLASAPPGPVPPPGQMGPSPTAPAPLPPMLGAPSEQPAVPGADRFVPTPAPVTPANPSSRVRK